MRSTSSSPCGMAQVRTDGPKCTLAIASWRGWRDDGASSLRLPHQQVYTPPRVRSAVHTSMGGAALLGVQ
eukprot:5404589-Prymnesium_polylepis.1